MGAESDSRDLRPCLGRLLGYMDSGYIYTTNSDAVGTVDVGALKIVKYGFLWLYSYDQRQNCYLTDNVVVGYRG